MHETMIFLTAAVILFLSSSSKNSSSHGTSGLSIQHNPAWSEKGLDTAAVYAEAIGTAAVLALHEGRVVFSYGDIRRKYIHVPFDPQTLSRRIVRYLCWKGCDRYR